MAVAPLAGHAAAGIQQDAKAHWTSLGAELHDLLTHVAVEDREVVLRQAPHQPALRVDDRHGDGHGRHASAQRLRAQINGSLGREKRGAGVTVTSLNENAVAPQPAVDVVALDEALERLAAVDPQQSRVVELRFFAGLSVEETADALGISPATVKRDWATAKLWLYNELSTE